MTARRITIEVEPGSTPRGHVFEGTEKRRPFIGWIGLLSSLATLIDRDPPERRRAGETAPWARPR